MHMGLLDTRHRHDPMHVPQAMVQAMLSLGLSIPPLIISKFLTQADIDQNGMFDYDEFAMLIADFGAGDA